MIRKLALEAARLLFSAAIAAAVVALVCAYASYRIVRKLTYGAPAMDGRQALFAGLIAAAGVVRAIKEQLPKEVNR